MKKFALFLQIGLLLSLAGLAQRAIAQVKFDRISCINVVTDDSILVRPSGFDELRRLPLYEVTVTSPSQTLVYPNILGSKVNIKTSMSSFYNFDISHSSMSEGRLTINVRSRSRVIEYTAEQNGWTLSGHLNYCDGRWKNQDLDFWLGN